MQGMKLGKRCLSAGWYFFEGLQNLEALGMIM